MGCAAVSHYYQAQGVSMATPCLDFTVAFSSTFTLSVCLSLPRTHKPNIPSPLTPNNTSALPPIHS